MFRGRPCRAWARTLVSLGVLSALTAGADPGPKSRGLTPAEARGKIIYTTGRSPSGRPLSIRLLGTEGSLPSGGFFCANCHGPEGKGGREGDIVMPDIRWATLVKPSRGAPPWNRARAAYTDALLVRAITEGVDASGQQLDASMPRWVLPQPDLRDLLQYLKRL